MSMSVSGLQNAKSLFSYRKYWAQRFGTAPFLPMTRAEMEDLGWDSCDIILVTGDAHRSPKLWNGDYRQAAGVPWFPGRDYIAARLARSNRLPSTWQAKSVLRYN